MDRDFPAAAVPVQKSSFNEFRKKLSDKDPRNA